MLQSEKRSWKRRRLASNKRLSLESSLTELENWICRSEELLSRNYSFVETADVGSRVENEMISKRDELKGIELLASECVEEEMNSDSGTHGHLELIIFSFLIDLHV